MNVISHSVFHTVNGELYRASGKAVLDGMVIDYTIWFFEPTD
jgi:hypothetical protein